MRFRFLIEPKALYGDEGLKVRWDLGEPFRGCCLPFRLNQFLAIGNSAQFDVRNGFACFYVLLICKLVVNKLEIQKC